MAGKEQETREERVGAQQNGDTLVIRVGTADAEIYRNVSDEQCLRILSEKSLGLADALRSANARLSAIRSEVLATPDNVVDYYLLQAAQARTDAALNLDIEDLRESDQSRRIEEFHRYSSIGSTLLYDGKNFSGGSKFLTATWPNMKWWPYKFNDRASSAKAWGGNILFQHSWYRGRKLYLIGIPYVQFDDLAIFDFDNTASSFVSLG